MRCLNERCKQILAFSIAALFIAFGFVLVIWWEDAIKRVLHNELAIQNGSKGFNNWVVTPIPMYLSFYLYNWTNADNVLKDWTIKPILQELGPYVFSEKHYRVNIIWNKNGTLSYQTKRVWHFVEKKSNGSLDDEVINVNVIACTIGNMVKDSNFFIKQTVNFFLEEKEKSLIVKKKVSEWLFNGYEDELLSLAKKLNISGLHMDKFGWFYDRNNSKTYDGTVTMYTGIKDIELLGIIEEWNGSPKSLAYKSYCGFVNGTSGELWPPVKKYNKVAIFANDLCSSLNLFHSNETRYYDGIQGREYVGTDYIFDNGSKYPAMECFNGPVTRPSGVRDISKCKQGAPAYVSYPHFYLGDKSYHEGVIGMEPNITRHRFNVVLEPTTGVPLYVNARLQINILISPYKGLNMFKGIHETMLPVMWFDQSAQLSNDLSNQVKLLLLLPSIVQYTGIGLFGIGALITFISLYITIKSAWRDNEQTQLLPDRM